jgi:V-type H+-transporting ATPase subunit A
MHRWPVRSPRPVADRKRPHRPLVTGQRALDVLFPCSLGGTVALTGGARFSNSVITFSLAKHTNVDVIVYVGCGQRGTDVGEVLMDLPAITVSIDGNDELVAKRTVIVANAANSSPAAREASVHTGIAIAEYFRDQGVDVLIVVDSLFRWSLARRSSAVGGAEGEEHIRGQIAAMYERAGRFGCVGGPAREGSITVVGMAGDAGRSAAVDAVTSASKASAQVVWNGGEDFSGPPYIRPMDWQASRSDCFEAHLTDFYERTIAEDFGDLRRDLTDILRQEVAVRAKELQRPTLGRDALSEREKATLDMARMIREDFLRQNVFTVYERRELLYKSAWLMRNIVLLHSLLQTALSPGDQKEKTKPSSSTPSTRTTTWDQLKREMRDLIDRVWSAKFHDFADGSRFMQLHDELKDTFARRS